MRNVDIAVFNIARTEVDRAEARKWLDYLGANEFEIPEGEVVSDPALLIALAAKRCEGRWHHFKIVGQHQGKLGSRARKMQHRDTTTQDVFPTPSAGASKSLEESKAQRPTIAHKTWQAYQRRSTDVVSVAV